MVQRYHNPFAGIDLVAPVEQRDLYDRYCQRSGSTIIDQSPFPRMVDFWFLGFTLGARKRLPSVDLSKKETFKFIEGSIFERDSWRVQTIMLVSIAVEDNIEIVREPRRMMRIANGLAAAGLHLVVEMLREGGQDPIWNLSEALQDEFGKK